MAGRYIPSEWPSDNTSSDDEIGHPGFNYSRHGIDNSRASASYRDHPTVVLLRIVSEVYLSMPIALFGVIGNLVSLVVLSYYRRLKKLHTVIIQLQALAVVDTLILLTILLLRSLRYVGPAWYVGIHSRIFPWMYPSVYFLRLLSVWLTVLLTVDRYIAVLYPLKVRNLCTVRRTCIMIASLTLVTLAFCLPRYFEYTFKGFEDGHVGFVSTPLLASYTYSVVYRIGLFISFQYVLPTLALVFLNTRLIVALRRSDTYRRSTTRYSPPPVAEAVTSSSSSQSTRSITLVVSVIVSICIVVHLVALTAHVVATVQVNLETPRSLDPVRRHLAQASNVLVTFNSAINFIIYCMISRKFRRLLVRHCCRCTPASSSSSSVSHGCRCWWCYWRVWRWCRRWSGRDSWLQSDADDRLRSTTVATNRSEPRPRSNISPPVRLPPAQQLTLPPAPQPQQQQQQAVKMRHLAQSIDLS